MTQRRFSFRRAIPAASLLVASLFLASFASAGVAFRFSGSIGESRDSSVFNNQSFDRTDPGGQGSVRFDEFPPASDESRHLLAVSSAGNGYLTASAHAEFVKTWIGGPSFNEYLSSYGFAKVTFDDVVFSGPNPTRTTSINVHLSGLIIAGALPQNSSNGNVQLIFYYNDDNVGGGYSSLNVYAGNSELTQTGPLVGFTGNNNIKSKDFEAAVAPNNNIKSKDFVVLTNVPVKIGIAFQVAASATANYSTTANTVANADFGSTLTLAIGRPVFDLPPGYTVNSVQAGIVNNIYTPPCPADFNHDNQVDDSDFTVFVVGYNLLDCADPSMTPGCPADVNYDGFVDDADFVVFVAAYNELLCP